MKQVVINHTSLFVKWACIGLIVSSQLFILTDAAAYDQAPAFAANPINISNVPIAANDAYGVEVNKTLTAPAPGVLANDSDLTDSPTATLVSGVANGTLAFSADGSFTYTPNPGFTDVDSFTYKVNANGEDSAVATVLITIRSAEFRPDDDDIDLGECVLFSWVVRGDIALIEFNQVDDDKDPILVSAIDDREECPTDETEYELIVSWLLGGSKTKIKHKIEVDTDVEDTDGGTSSSSSGTGAVSGGTTGSPQAGTFAMVTPVLITDAVVSVAVTPVPETGTGEDAPASFSNSLAEKPTGVLGTINALPETGVQPYVLESEEKAPKAPASQVKQVEIHPGRELPIAMGGLILLSGMTILVLFIRDRRRFG